MARPKDFGEDWDFGDRESAALSRLQNSSTPAAPMTGTIQIRQTAEYPYFSFCEGAPDKEVMRIDKNGVTVNPAYPMDEAAQHVIKVMDDHIKALVAPQSPKSPPEILDMWVKAHHVSFVSRTHGMQTTKTVSRDDLIELIKTAQGMMK